MLFGKSRALEILEKEYENAKNGQGNLILITGEAGIGKTTLVEHFLKERNCVKLVGKCLPMITPPLQPFKEALSKEGLENLLAEVEIPKITMLYVVHSTGLLVSKAERVDLGIDTDIFTSMLSAVGMFVKDSFEKISSGDEYLEEIRFGRYNLVMKQGSSFSIVAVLQGKSNEFLHRDLEELLYKIEEEFGEILAVWDGDMGKVSAIEDTLREFVYSGKYDGGIVEGDVQEWSFENVRLGLKRVARENVVCIFMDDIQWADESTLSLILYLARNCRNEKMLIICTYRQMERSEELNNFLDAVVREELATTITLEPISFDEMIPVLKGMLNGEVSISLVDYVYRKSGGIPLYIVELVRMLREEKAIVSREGVYYIAEEKDVSPKKVESIVMRRVRKLGDEKEILEFASVLGATILPDVISCAFGMKKIALIRILRKLKENGFLEVKGDGYSFYHEHIREIIYRNIDEVMKKEYHGIAAECIEKLYPEEFRIPMIANHYYKSGKYEKAMECGFKGAEILRKKYGYRDSVKLYEIALRSAEKLKENDKVFKALMALAEVYGEIGDFHKAIEYYKKANEMKPEDYRVFLGIGNMYVKMGNYKQAMKYYQEAKDMAGEAPEISLAIGNIMLKMGNLESAEKEFLKYLKWAEEIGDEEKIILSYKSLGTLYWYRMKYENAENYYIKALELSKRKDMKKQTADLLHNIGTMYYDTGRLEESLKMLQESLSLREKIGDIGSMPVTYNLLGLVYWNLGNISSAKYFFEKALEYSRILGRKHGEARVLANLGIMYYYDSKYKEAEEFLKKSIEIFEGIGDEYSLVEPMLYLLSIYIEKRNAEAKELYRKAENLVGKIGVEDYSLWLEVIGVAVGIKDEKEILRKITEKPLLLAIHYRFKYVCTRDEESLKKAVENFKKAGFLAPIYSMIREEKIQNEI